MLRFCKKKKLNIEKLTYTGGPGFKSRPGQTSKTCNFEALEVTTMYFTFLKPLIFFYLDKRGQELSCMFICDILLGILISLLHKIAFDWFILGIARYVPSIIISWENMPNMCIVLASNCVGHVAD